MDYFVPAIDPLYALGSNVNVSNIRNDRDVEQEFMSIFLSQVFKDVMKSQTTMFGTEGSLGLFSDNMYNDIMISKISREIAANKEYGFDKVISEGNKIAN